MRTKQLESIIEAILFTMGDSVEVSKIASAIEQDVPTTEKLIHNMMDKYQKEERGIRIIELDHAYQLCSKPEMYEYLIRIAKQPKKYVLTDVMLETLSIIAYRQPITKLEIEKIRGVKSDHAVNKLIEYNLVCELGRLDAPMTSVVAVEVAPDLKTCKAYISVLGDEKAQADTLKGLQSAEGYIRRELAHTLNMRNTPEIKFVLDQSIEYGVRMSKKIDDVTRDLREEDD